MNPLVTVLNGLKALGAITLVVVALPIEIPALIVVSAVVLFYLPTLLHEFG